MSALCRYNTPKHVLTKSVDLLDKNTGREKNERGFQVFTFVSPLLQVQAQVGGAHRGVFVLRPVQYKVHYLFLPLLYCQNTIILKLLNFLLIADVIVTVEFEKGSWYKTLTQFEIQTKKMGE